jgi:hypothetical protein
MRPQPRVQMKKAHELVTTVTPVSPGIPRAMVLTVSSALSPVTGLVCHRRLRVVLANLTPASGRQDHTASPSASCSVRPHMNVPEATASTASRPAFVTIASVPLWDGTAGDIRVIWGGDEEDYCLKKGLTANFRDWLADLPVGQISAVGKHISASCLGSRSGLPPKGVRYRLPQRLIRSLRRRWQG